MTVLLFAFHGATFLTLRTSGELCERAAAPARRSAVPVAMAASPSSPGRSRSRVDNNEGVFPPGRASGPRGRRAGAGRSCSSTAAAAAGRSSMTGARDDRAGRDDLHRPVPARDGLVARLRAQPDGLQRVVVALRAEVMTIVAVIFVPIVLLYQSWTYHVFRRASAASSPRSSAARRFRPGETNRPPAEAAMRALDPRLLRRAGAARLLLGARRRDRTRHRARVLLQAALLARIVARAFAGAALGGRDRRDSRSLAHRVRARGALAWGIEVAGRRGACSVLSELRLALVEHRLRAQPAALDGVEGGEIAAVAVAGRRGARGATSRRYLPQVVLAWLVPFAVLAWVAPIDSSRR